MLSTFQIKREEKNKDTIPPSTTLMKGKSQIYIFPQPLAESVDSVSRSSDCCKRVP